MINKSDIEKTLDDLDLLFLASLDSDENMKASYYSKLAVLELCGWIECVFDEIIEIFNPNIIGEANIKFFEDNVIKHTYGFQYNKDFRKMLIMVIGLISVCRVEENVNRNCAHSDISTLKSELGTLKTDRDNLAHTFTNGVQTNLVRPEQIKGRLNRIYPTIKEIETELIRVQCDL